MTEHAVKPASRSGLAFDPSLRATAAGSRKAKVARPAAAGTRSVHVVRCAIKSKANVFFCDSIFGIHYFY
ncbi:hypothetical protein [Bacillus sp. 2205SS5-2]|uniref:hypothetical protein n=1 Tax=Bacillus sp. 2205SS5-2 TaxID=3109031 RepID=UPI0030066964